MDIAIVTGAGSGVGLAVARKLVETGYRVYGLGGSYKDIGFSHHDFVPTSCDLGNREELRTKVGAIIEKEGPVECVVNNAKVYPKGALESTSLEDIETTVRINLLCPLWLAQLTQQGLRQTRGHFINIAPTHPDGVRGGAVGAATGGGLKWMNDALFNELRDYGVKVCTIYPQVNRERPADAGAPAPGRPAHSTIDPANVANAVHFVVTHREGNIISELVLRPERLREPEEPAVVEIPCPPPKPLPIPEARTIYKLAKEAKFIEPEPEPRKPARSRRKPREDHEDRPEPGRPRRGRGRENAKTGDGQRKPQERPAAKPEQPDRETSAPPTPESATEEPRMKRRKRRNRGRDADKKRATFRPGEAGEGKQPYKPAAAAHPAKPPSRAEKPKSVAKPVPQKTREPKPAARGKPGPERQAAEAPKKTAARKQTATRKTAKKKTAVKKTAATKKTATRKVATRKVATKKTTARKVTKKKAAKKTAQ